ncbi:MAG TPA: hypothetical protein VIW68_12215 [Candidatus Sulfotelmatobacter sp.]
MRRPAGITVIAILFLLAAGFLGAVGVLGLFAPGTISMMSGAPLMYGLELAGPYMALLIGSAYGLVGWGLFRLRRWARWAAMMMMAVGIGLLVPAVSAAASDIGWSLLWYGSQIMVRAAVAWYLAQAPAVLESFAKK